VNEAAAIRRAGSPGIRSGLQQDPHGLGVPLPVSHDNGRERQKVVAGPVAHSRYRPSCEQALKPFDVPGLDALRQRPRSGLGEIPDSGQLSFDLPRLPGADHGGCDQDGNGICHQQRHGDHDQEAMGRPTLNLQVVQDSG
jgi:hypothetical protein